MSEIGMYVEIRGSWKRGLGSELEFLKFSNEAW